MATASSASSADYAITALALWREDRGGGSTGMTAVACVIRNRVLKNHSSFYTEVTKKKQFTSISEKGDPQLALWPTVSDSIWISAQLVAQNVIEGTVSDITGGATLYYNPNAIQTTAKITLPTGQTIPFPQTWNPAVVTYTCTLGGHYFFIEH